MELQIEQGPFPTGLNPFLSLCLNVTHYMLIFKEMKLLDFCFHRIYFFI